MATKHLADSIAPVTAISPTTGAIASTNAVGAIYDTEGAGIDGVLVIVGWGTITSGGAQSIKLEDGNDSGLSDAAEVAGTGHTVLDTNDGTVFMTDIRRPKKRYLRLTVLRATQTSAVTAYYLGYGTRNRPAVNAAANVVAVKRVTSAGNV